MKIVFPRSIYAVRENIKNIYILFFDVEIILSPALDEPKSCYRRKHTVIHMYHILVRCDATNEFYFSGNFSMNNISRLSYYL